VRTATALSPNDASVSVKKPSACEASLQIGTQRITALSKLRQKRSESKPQLVRIAHREIEILGLGQGFWGDLHHRSMSVHWPVFFGSAAAMFVVLNAIFGFLYSLGQEPIANAPENGPLAYFYFSIETLATVGYGDMHPKSNYGHLIATIEIFTGMSFLAVMPAASMTAPPNNSTRITSIHGGRSAGGIGTRTSLTLRLRVVSCSTTRNSTTRCRTNRGRSGWCEMRVGERPAFIWRRHGAWLVDARMTRCISNEHRIT
jgi:Ion channel